MRNGDEMESKNKTVIKSMSILNLFLSHERLTLAEMVALLGAPKTTVYRMVCSFEEMGFLQRDEGGVYALGLAFLQFGQLVSERLDIRRIVLPVMQALRDHVEEAVNLIIRDDDEAVYVEKVDTIRPVRIYNSPGRRAPLYAGACPRVLLTFSSEESWLDYLDRVHIRPIASGTMTEVTQILHTLRDSRAKGYTVSHSELEDDTSAVAAPIYNHLGQVVAGLSIAGLSSRFQEDRLPELIESVMKAANECSSRLGFCHHLFV